MKVDVLSGVSRKEGGLYYSVRWLSKTMAAMENTDVRLISHIDEFTREDLPVWDPLPVKLYRAYGPLLSSYALRNILNETTADLLHVHGIWLDRQWAAHQWAKKKKKPVVISPRGMLDPWAVRNAAWKKKLVGALFANESLRGATCIHALCDSEAESIRKYGLKTPIAVIPNGVELPQMNHSRANTNGSRRLLFLGRLHPKKGLKELIEAWSMVHRQKLNNRCEWELLIAGWDDGGHEAELKKMVSDYGIQTSVSFLGPQFGDEKDELMRSVDAFILPSFSEGLPMSVLEAWSYGLPVVMTEFCNLPSGFEAGAALKIEPEVRSIFGGLDILLNWNDEELLQMGAKGRKLVEDCFSWEQIAREMLDVYRWCMGGDRPACIRMT